MNISISPMTPSQVPAVAALEAASFSTPWSERSIRSELENPWAIWLTATDGDALLGYLGVQYGPDGGDLLTVAVDPACRGQRIAQTLLETVCRALREKSLRYLTLEVRPSNLSALALYRRLGFRPVGRRKSYYRSPTEDALLLTLFFDEEEDHADPGD